MFQVCLQDIALQQQAGEFALSNNLDQSCGFEFFQVVRERGRGHGLALAHIRASNASGLGAYLGQDLVTTRIGQGFCDQVDLTIGELCRFRQTPMLRFLREPSCSREVSISAVTRAHRPPAIESNHQLFE